MPFDEKRATAEELWDYCLEEYRSRNPIARRMFEGFFSAVGRALDGVEPADRILEVGCGAGESSRRILSMLNGQYFEASDHDPRYIAMLRKNGFPSPVSQESVLCLKRADREFDWIIMLEVLEHLGEYSQALREVFRVSRKHVVISVPNEPLWSLLNMLRGKYWAGLGNTPGHVNRWTPTNIVRIIREHGTVVNVLKPIPWTIVHANL